MQEANVDLIEFSSLVPIKALAIDHCRELLNQSEVKLAAKGGLLYEQGSVAPSAVYVMSGEVVLKVDGKPVKRIKGGTRLGKLPLEQGPEHHYTAQALTEVVYVNVDSNALDIMLSWDKSSGVEVQELDTPSDEGDDDWMAKLLQTKIFQRIPPANIQSIFMKMETHHFKAGESVIRQGEEGEHFYIIREGKCQVSRKTRKNPEGMILATLRAGDNFGEESLISGGKRNATITMETDGVLMSLSKSDFLELLNNPLLKWISYSDAREMVVDGAIWIDVRLPQEYQDKHIKHSVNIPLPLLRAKLGKLDPEKRYLMYCDSGRRGSIGTYLLSQEGFDVFVLQDALDTIPESDLA